MLTTSISNVLWRDMYKILVGKNVVPGDMERWSQGFNFCDAPNNFGLKQTQGGPCGVLAAVQAEVLSQILFNDNSAATMTKYDEIPQYSVEDIREALYKALIIILKRAQKEDQKEFQMFEITNNNNRSMIDILNSESDKDACPIGMFLHKISNESALYEFMSSHEQMYQSPNGVLLFLLSAIYTRGLDVVKSDMDDCENTMIGRFGHCTQDLMNLLLSGRAVSNVFDGNRPFEGANGDTGLMVKGISYQGRVGYLSQLDALGYLEVGEFYKRPKFPIWVIGSSSHFTVVFCLQKEVNEESEAEALLSRARRAFRAADENECGFIASDRLWTVMIDLEWHRAADEAAITTLKDHIKIDGDIILWATFWENISQLLSGKSLEELVGNDNNNNNNNDVVYMGQGDIIDGNVTRQRSDSDIAREMQDQWSNEWNDTMMDTSSSTAVTAPHSNTVQQLDFSSLLGGTTTLAPAPAPISTTGLGMRSDSEIALALQQQLNAEAGSDFHPIRENGSKNDNNGSIPHVVASPSSSTTMTIDVTGDDIVHPNSSSSSINNNEKSSPVRHRADSIAKEDDSNAFILYHWNGMQNAARGARLTKVKMHCRTVEDNIGQAVAMNGGTPAWAIAAGNPLEEVLRTRWPGCRVRLPPGDENISIH